MIRSMICEGEFIADFDRKKVMYLDYSDIEACALIYKSENNISYHLFLQREDEDNFYPVTFFVREDDNYYKEQNSYKIVSVTKNNGGKKKKSKK